MRRERGVSLIIAMAAVALVLGVMTTAATMQRYRLLARENRIHQRNAKIAAEAAIQRALVDLADVNVNSVSFQDTWYTNTNQADKLYSLGKTSFRYEIIDASSLLNLNTITEAQLQKLNLTTEQIDSLLDWREASAESARTDGAKDDYYNKLTNPYNAKLGNFDSVDELLSVKGFLPTDLYEIQTNTTSTVPESPLYLLMNTDSNAPNTTASGGTKLNPSSASLQQMMDVGISNQLAMRIMNGRGGGYSSIAAVLQLGGLSVEEATQILENFATNTATQINGRININTAPKNVLETLPGITSDVVDAILSRQSAGFESLEELSSVAGISVELLQQWADLICVGSQVFIIRAVGIDGNTTVPLEAVVTISSGTAKVIKVSRTPFVNMISRWNWTSQPSSQITLVSTD